MKLSKPRIEIERYKSEDVKAILILLFILTLLFFDVIFLGKTISSSQVPGVMASGPYNYPAKYTHRALIDPGGSTWGPRAHTVAVSSQYKKGIFPLWISEMGTGQPLAANMDSNAFNPLRILLYINPSSYMWDLYLIFRLYLAGVFAYFFMKSLSVSFEASLLSAILFTYSGYFVFSIDMHHLDVEIFLPFVFLCFEKIYQRKHLLKWCVLGTFSIFFAIAGGQPQSAFLIISFACLFFIFRLIISSKKKTFKWIFAHLGTIACVLTLGFLFSAFLILPFMEFLKYSSNNHSPGLGSSYNPFYSDAISFIVPYFMGMIHMPWLDGYSWHNLTRGYVGVASVLFCLSAAIEAFRKRKDKKSHCIVFFTICLILMLLKIYGAPVVNWIGKLPIANMVNFGKYLGPLIAFCFAVLAGFGAEIISRKNYVDKMTFFKCGYAIILLALCFFLYHAKTLISHNYNDHRMLQQFAVMFFVIVSLSVIHYIFACKEKINPKIFMNCVIFVSIIELFIYIPNPGIFKNRNIRYDIFTKAPYIDFIKKNLGNFRIIGKDRILYPDFASAFGLSDLRVLDALLVSDYMTLIGTGFKLPSPPDRFTGDEGIDINQGTQRLMNLLGVKYFLCNSAISGNSIEDILNSGRIIHAPGQPYSNWVNGSSLTINNENKNILFEHAPSRIDYDIKIKEDTCLKFSIGMVSGSWSPEKGDGVLFDIVLDDGIQKKSIFAKYIDPKNKIEDRKWHNFSLDLTEFQGKSVVLSFITKSGPNDDNNYDWSAWGDIRFIKKSEVKEFDLVYDGEIKIYENLNVYPRAFIATNYRQFTSKVELISAFKDNSIDLRNIVLIEGDIPEEVKDRLMENEDTGRSDVILQDYSEQYIKLNADLKQPGFVVLTDTYFPGWHAFVNGKETKIYKADCALRAVFADKGINQIEFKYKPDSFRFGSYISISTLIIAMLSAFCLAFINRYK